MASHQLAFVVDGRSRAREAVIAAFRARQFQLVLAARRKYAAEFAAAGRLRRARLVLRIRREIQALLRAELHRLASIESLY
ncbi:MAG TPA: hypothetical protein VHD36_18600 [Pirellulales bacterium]|nr:hypothetical protein [Pirellulales bacterium]